MKRSLGKMSKRTRLLGAALRLQTPTKLVRKYKIGELVILDHQSRYEGMPHPRYRGKIGTIIAARGKAYEVKIRDMRATKILVVPAVHLKAKIE